MHAHDCKMREVDAGIQFLNRCVVPVFDVAETNVGQGLAVENQLSGLYRRGY